jgi:hypothetical protein
LATVSPTFSASLLSAGDRPIELVTNPDVALWQLPETLTLSEGLVDVNELRQPDAAMPEPESSAHLLSTGGGDFGALQEALRQFLANVEHLGQQLAGHVSWGGVGLAVLASAAAMVAWEMRNRRSAVVSFHEGAVFGWVGMADAHP